MLEAAAPFEDFEALDTLGQHLWAEAQLAALVYGVGGRNIGGLHVRARSGGVLDAYLEILRVQNGEAAPWIRLPSQVALSRLTGGIDIAATADTGRIVARHGVLARADGGTLLIPMAERLGAGHAAVIAAAMDTGLYTNPALSSHHGERTEKAAFAVVAIDESIESEQVIPGALADRLGLTVNLDHVAWHHVSPVTRQGNLPEWDACRTIGLSQDVMGLFAAAGEAAGNTSLRRLHHLANTARILAALSGRSQVEEPDAVMAIRLCLGIRIEMPSPEPEAQAEPEQPQQDEPPQGEGDPPPPDDAPADEENDTPPLTALPLDALTEILAASVSGGVLDPLDLSAKSSASRQGGGAGKAGAPEKNAKRGRPYGVSASPPYADARPDIVATLRTAAPWQMIRRRERDALVRQSADTPMATDGRGRTAMPRALIRTSDFRYKRLRHARPSTAIFIVDASGSTALERLGETKGTIEQLLARCYVRRDEVALIVFRGRTAEIVLEPTRSLVLAKRTLTGLPGGGPTPLVCGLEKGLELSLAIRRRGHTPVVVLLTDGSGNIALNGEADRERAASEMATIAPKYRALAIKALCIDIARRPRPAVRELAAAMGADYHILRRADGTRMSEIVDKGMQEAVQ